MQWTTRRCGHFHVAVKVGWAGQSGCRRPHHAQGKKQLRSFRPKHSAFTGGFEYGPQLTRTLRGDPFFGQVDPSLPELYVTAGLSALDLSEAFCRDHSLGPSQVPLVRNNLNGDGTRLHGYPQRGRNPCSWGGRARASR